jgi:polyhydroxyalkanoate synthesis regulator phasin
MISLRLSDAEYAVLKSQYRTFGARNVSDMARRALQQIMQASTIPRDPLTSRLASLEERVHALENEISVLTDRDLANT